MPRLLYVNDFQNRANPGISTAVNTLIAQISPLLSSPDDVWLACVGDVDLPPSAPILPHTLSRSRVMRAWRYSPSLGQGLDATIRDHGISIIHTHGAWMHPQMAAGRAAAKAGIPLILTNHGLFSTWAMAQPGHLGALKKRLYLKAFASALFDRVSVYHAITPMDRDAMRILFPGKRIEVIPNSIDMRSVSSAAREKISQNDPYIFFCGRLHPQKGLDLLIEAFGMASISNDLRLVIAGPDENPDYANFIRGLIGASPRRNRIDLLGPIWAPAEKYALMRGALVTAVPSRHEVVSLVNLESSACSTPTITTHATGLFDWEDGGGMLVDTSISALVKSIERAAAWSSSERQARGEASYRLVEKRYSTDATGRQWMDLYRSA